MEAAPLVSAAATGSLLGAWELIQVLTLGCPDFGIQVALVAKSSGLLSGQVLQNFGMALQSGGGGGVWT